VEHIFKQVKGVVKTRVGYMGGSMEHPGYRDVSTGTTGHAEAVRVEFDPSVISYEELLGYFWRLHDPTQLNRQGPDLGTQYRSLFFITLRSRKRPRNNRRRNSTNRGIQQKIRH